MDQHFEDHDPIHILLSMKHAVPKVPSIKVPSIKVPSPSVPSNHGITVPKIPQIIKIRTSPVKRSNGCSCLVCIRGAPQILHSSPTWSTIMRVVFYTLKKSKPHREYFNLRTDVYTYLHTHWNKLCLNKDVSQNWKKQVQDMLSHSKGLFESGSGLYKQNGYWKLRLTTDPWDPQQPQQPPQMERNVIQVGTKRGSTDGTSGSDEDFLVPEQKKRKLPYFKGDDFIVPVIDNSHLLTEFETLKAEMETMRESMRTLSEELKQECNCVPEINEISTPPSTSSASPQTPSPPSPPSSSSISSPTTPTSSPSSPSSSPTTPNSPTLSCCTPPQVYNPLITVLTSNVLNPLQVVPQREGQATM